MEYSLPERDLHHIVSFTGGLWEELKGEQIFISGGTGFFGRWLVESFLFANEVLNLRSRATILTRSPQNFERKAPAIARHSSINLHKGDIRTFNFPPGNYSFIIHGANESIAKINGEDPDREHFEIITDGTRHILEFAAAARSRKFLFTSSGAVYGRQPPELERVPESFNAVNEESLTIYGKGKIAAEKLCAEDRGLEIKTARCFCFLGPYLPLNEHFAAGNFIRDVLRGNVINVNGDGTPIRSYLHPSDLAVWLWTILLKGKDRSAYNVGSEQSVSILQLAARISHLSGKECTVHVHKQAVPGVLPERYVPDTTLARTGLGLEQRISLDDAIERTLSWLTAAPSFPA